MQVITAAIICLLLIGRPIFIAGIIIIVPLLIAALANFYTTSITLDKQGVTYKKGWLSIKKRHIPYRNINAVDTATGLVGGRYDYGTLSIFTGNDKQAIKFVGLDRADKVKRILQKQIRLSSESQDTTARRVDER